VKENIVCEQDDGEVACIKSQQKKNTAWGNHYVCEYVCVCEHVCDVYHFPLN